MWQIFRKGAIFYDVIVQRFRDKPSQNNTITNQRVSSNNSVYGKFAERLAV
jgi:hypothetical protein